MIGNEESISIEEIHELALRYIEQSECGALIRPKEVFALLVRQTSAIFSKKKKDWLFAGYAMLLDYTINPDEKPYGKWITIKYLSLNTFPPTTAEIRLQPPHIAKGYFQSFDRTSETKIVPIVSPEIFKTETEAEILQFPTTPK